MVPNIFRRLFFLIITLALLPGLTGETPALAQSGHTSATVTRITIPTHPVESALTLLTNPDFNMPYYRLDRGRYDGGRIENREFTLIVLENDYLRLSILPELGGRIYQAVFKSTGNNVFYQNPVLKPSPWGPTEMGWWLAAGGMEWGLPVEEHGYEWGIPWQYDITELPDGVRVELWDTTATDRLRARVAVTLWDDASFIEISPTVENPTATAMNYKFWLNAMLAPGPANQVSPRLRIVLPTETVTVHSSGDSRLPGQWQRAGWPLHNGVDWSLLGNWREWYGFFQYPRAEGNFQAIYDEGYDEGMVRTYDSTQVQGAKFFAFGHGPSALSPDLYTDDNSSYVEMHSGVAPTFADTRRLGPGEAFTWTERWYPVAGLGSLTWANEAVALHLADDGDATRLSLATTRRTTEGRILLLHRASGEVLFETEGQTIAPDQPYQSPELTLPNLTREQMAVLVYNGSALLGAYQFDGPPPVTPTPGPSPTPTAALTWQGQWVRTTPFNSWASILRIWVRNQIGLPVTLSTESGSWQVSGLVGSKAEYGVDALEFAPLAPDNYLIRPQGLNADFHLALPPGVIAEVVFEQRPASLPTATPIVMPTFTPTTTPTASNTPTPAPPSATPSPTPTSTPTPTPLPPTATPTATPTPPTPPTPLTTPTPPAWQGYVRREIPFAGWASVARIWVLDYPATAVTISAVNWGWQATNFTGTKLEYGPNALEFAPLAPGRYRVRVPAINTELTMDLQPGRITEIVFERAALPATATPAQSPPATATATPSPTVAPTATTTSSPTLTPTATKTPLPTATPTATATPTTTNTPLPTATVTPSPSPTATPVTVWQARLESNRVVSSNWFGVIRVSVEGQRYSLAHAAMLDGDRPVWRTYCVTGTKPEFGPYFCEFSPLIPGRFLLTAAGVDASITVEVGRGAVAVVLFEH